MNTPDATVPRSSFVNEHIRDAINAHNLDAFVDCFAADFESHTPAHPARSFRGSDQVRINWTQIFAAVPDLQADLLRSQHAGDIEWAEWDWHGTRRDGTSHQMRGVTITGARNGRAAWVRFYMEPVDLGDTPVAEAIRTSLQAAGEAAAK